MSEQSVRLVQANAEWPRQYQREQQRLGAVLAGCQLEHIGSTSIPDLVAKPTIDILVGAPEDELEAVRRALEGLGYRLEGTRPGHSWLCYPRPTERQYIVHLVVFDGEEWQRRLGFRDYLRQHPEAVRAYQDLKQELAEQFANDLDGYTRGKHAFVKAILAKHQVHDPK